MGMKIDVLKLPVFMLKKILETHICMNVPISIFQ